jgi:hypothetical protein
MKRFLCVTAMLLASASPARAITVDGTVKPAYFAPVAVQDTPTGFGNNESELNAAYARLDASGNLSLLLTGNLQNNGNGLVLFIDSRAGGGVADSVTLSPYGILGSIGGAKTDDWGTDTDGSGGVNPTPGGGSILDPGFNPDISIEINSCCGSTYYTNIIDLTKPNDPDPDRDIYLGSNDYNVGSSGAQTYSRTDTDASKGHGGTITHAFNNLNTAGVSDTDASTALTATTGYEALISSQFLANDGQRIKIMAFITNGGGDYLSNQFLGEAGLAGANNLGGPGDPGGTPLFDASKFGGNQYFTVPIAGDFNHDGLVNTADYVLWRKVDGSNESYAIWRAKYGNAAGSGTGGGLSAGGVPEAGSFALAMVAIGLLGTFGRRK